MIEDMFGCATFHPSRDVRIVPGPRPSLWVRFKCAVIEDGPAVFYLTVLLFALSYLLGR